MKNFFFSTKLKAHKFEKGMTYVELIVVLSIMGIMSAIIIPNYNILQKKIETKNLTNEIALKIVEAQKEAMSGQLPDSVHQSHIAISSWHPSYGVYFNSIVNNKKFVYFTDLNNAGYCDSSCDMFSINDPNFDYIDAFNITGDEYIKKIQIFPKSNLSNPTSVGKLSINFTRPDSSAVFASSILSSDPIEVKPDVLYVEITVSASSQNSIESVIRIYQSGRIEIR